MLCIAESVMTVVVNELALYSLLCSYLVHHGNYKIQLNQYEYGVHCADIYVVYLVHPYHVDSSWQHPFSNNSTLSMIVSIYDVTSHRSEIIYHSSPVIGH